VSDKTLIEWTDATWNPITGCSIVSPGCTNCYAMRLAGTRMKYHPTRIGLTVDSKAGPVWNGQVRFNEQALDQPLRWRRPRRIFVCAHGDLFAEGVPDEWIDRVFAVMALSPQHTFQVLTKRPARMRSYLADRDAVTLRLERPMEELNKARGGRFGLSAYELPYRDGPWPLPNVWLGTSVEDQRRADERIPELLATPAAVRFISAEPLLGPIALDRICLVPQRPGSIRAGIHINALAGRFCESGMPYFDRWNDDGTAAPGAQVSKLDWVIVGGESGPNARPMHPDWARSLRDQCAAAGVAFLFKQWGEYRPLTDAEHGQACGAKLVGRDPHDREAYVLRVGKRAAGRLLDGVEHNGMPGVRP
jgi:protein gp37